MSAKAIPVSKVMRRQLPALLGSLLRVKRERRKGGSVLPWKLEFFTTYSCGSRCKTCLIWTRYEREPELRAKELSPEAFGKITASVGEHLRWISFTGGEITDRDDALELATQVVDAAPRARVISSSSHGLAPERTESLFGALAERYPDRAIMVTLSLDGLSESYEKIRGVDGFDAVIESMARLKALSVHHPNLQASYQVTLSRLNLHEADALIDYVAGEAEGNVVTIANDSRVLTEGRIKDIDVRLDERLMAALSRATKSSRFFDINGQFARVYMGLVRAMNKSGEAPIPCSAGLASLTVGPYGEVLQCDRHDEALGHIAAPDFNLEHLIRSPEFQAKLEPLRDCRECFTPCQAYPSMMQAPIKAGLGSLKQTVSF
jgi:MoaA/NifB/PqqE/SkfB family radical SAM enzyme